MLTLFSIQRLAKAAKLTLISVAMCGVAPFAMAKGISYDCTRTQMQRGGWIPPRVILAYDPETLVGSAYDGYIDEAHGAPIPVKVKRVSATRIQFKWSLLLKSDSKSTHNVTYTVGLNTKRNKYSVHGLLHGYENRIGGGGSCVLLK